MHVQKFETHLVGLATGCAHMYERVCVWVWPVNLSISMIFSQSNKSSFWTTFLLQHLHLLRLIHFLLLLLLLHRFPFSHHFIFHTCAYLCVEWKFVAQFQNRPAFYSDILFVDIVEKNVQNKPGTFTHISITNVCCSVDWRRAAIVNARNIII